MGFLLSLMAFSCDAPRNNPLDSLNENSNLAVLEGVILNQSFPSYPVEDVEVTWENQNITVRTDQSGRFRFNNISLKPGTLSFHKEGYFNEMYQLTDSIIAGRKKIVLNGLTIDAKPILENVQLYSVYLNKIQSSIPTIYTVVSLKITDKDGTGDIDSVFLRHPGFKWDINLDYQEYLYKGFIYRSDLDDSTTFDAMVGKDIEIWVNGKNRETQVGTSVIKRLVKEPLKIRSPLNSDTISMPILLNWNKFDAGYKFHYYFEIREDDTDVNLIMEENNITSDRYYFTINESNMPPGMILPEGVDYKAFFWLLWCVDEYGNRAASTQAKFVLKR